MSIMKESVLKVVDNSGAKFARCIAIYKNKSSATVGDLIRVSICGIYPKSVIPRKKVMLAIIVRTKQTRPSGPLSISFDENALVLVNENKKPIGSRVSGASIALLREKCPQVASLMSKIY